MLRHAEMESSMFMKILTASTLVVGLATSAAMAQSVDGANDVYTQPDATVMPSDAMPADTMAVDPGTTRSIYPDSTMGMNNGTVRTGPMGPCASDPGGMGPDANMTSGVTDNYCGK